MFEDTFLTIKGCKIRFRRHGTGPVVLYLHGANGVPKVQPFLFELAKSFDVIVPEHPGFGESDEPSWLENMQDLVYFYLDLMDQLHLEHVHVIGSSLGGWLAMELALRQPSRFSSLTLIGAAGIRIPEAQPGDIFLWSPEKAAQKTFKNPALVAWAIDNPLDQDTTLKNRHTCALLAWAPRLHNPMLAKWLHRLTMPVQLVWGEDDEIMPLPYAHALQKLISQSLLSVYPNCGHLPQVEKSEEFVELVTHFISKVAQS
jgi:pimeloyl-ACP methyl ester carboxylesterase